MSQEYRTSDLYEAGALYASGEKMVGIDTKRKPFIFVFGDDEACRAKSIEYINNELAVLAKDYADAIKLLKNRVNNMRVG